MKRISSFETLVVSLAMMLATAHARADEAPASEAELLFQHGVELMKADDCANAIPEFLKSNALDASAATLLNVGTCYARLGRKATAWKAYQRASVAALSENDAPLRERALQAMAILGPTLTKVQIVTPKDSTPLSLRINGETLSDYDGLPIPLDPGQSVIEAAAPGREPWRRTVTADELGATLVIQVPDLRAVPPLPPAVRPVVAPARVEERSPDYRVPAAIVGGAGVAAVVAGSIFGLSAQSSYDASRSSCLGNRCTQAGIDERTSARDKATASTVLFTVGLAAVVAGVVLWIVSPSATHVQKTALRKAPLRVELDSQGMLVESGRW
jgi:hypothetical protein